MRDGWRVVRGFVPVDEVEDALFAHALACVHRDAEVVFNPDNRRTQLRLRWPPGKRNDGAAEWPSMARRLHDAFVAHGLLRGRTVDEVHVIRSARGCARQPTHYDYDPDEVAACRVAPLSVLVALERDTVLHIDGATVALAPGDAALFAGDVPHAGAAYARAANARVHAYLDVPSCTRRPNTTYFANEP